MPFKKIAVCTDFSENASAAFDVALEMAVRDQAQLMVVHVLPPAVNPMLTDSEWVVPDAPPETLVPRLEERLQNEYGTRIGSKTPYEIAILNGHVATAIVTFLEERQVDLVVLGAFGFTGVGLVLFGSVAKRVSHKAPCSVMIVRPRPAARP